ncbi:MAG: hypothetical protein IJW86_01630 [Clostridia bacterium]|nr:hypothetical protein [Clostridia bacterium]
MKKTLAVILSVIMLLGVMPFAGFAADSSDYDRAAVAANDEAYIADMTAEQMASVILDWADREIAKYTEDIEADIVAGVIANGGFEEFEAILGEDAMGNIIADQIPAIDSLDAIIGYKSYLAELGGDFANLNATNLITRAEAGSAIGFINGVIQFMADNSETFGKVFRWDGYVVDENGAVTDYGNVFDYGKVGDYIETLNGTDEQAIYDFYINYLVGNDIQAKFTKWVADQMGYTIPEGENFDDTLNDGIMAWFSGLCETNGIFSAEGLATLRAYDLRKTDIYTLVKNFVALVQSDNQVKIDTYYNYLMDTVVRTLLKTTLGQTATVGAAATVPAGFTATYTDLALLEEISGGTAYYKDGDAYYQVTIAEGAVTACNAITWADALDINFEAPTATIYTGANCDEEVQVYRPTSEDVPVLMYASEKNQALMADQLPEGMTFAGTAVTEEYAALMTEANAKALSESFGITVAQGEEIISKLELSFAEIEEYAEGLALTAAQEAAEAALTSMGMDTSLVSVEAVDITISYEGYATEDEFICNVVVSDPVVTLGGMGATLAQSMADSAAATAVGTYIDNPVVTVVVDNLSGNLNIDDAKALLDFIDTDFAIDADLLDIAGNYDAYDGAVGQVNHILYGLVDMLVSDSGMTELALVDGDNTNFTANLEKICAKANDMMAAAEEVMNDEGLQEMLAGVGIDLSAMLGEMDLDLLYAIDFSSVEALWVSVITLGLDMIDDGSNATITEIHTLIGDLTNLDAMAVALADYALGKCIPSLNTTLAEAGVDFALTVPAKTDAASVADGAGKDIIMTKLVDVIYEAAVEGVALVNSIANEALATIATETGIEMPTVAFKLGVEKGADWEATLAALVTRVYGLANGIIIACAEQPADTIDAISKVANAILPLGSLASNCASANYAFDGNLVMGYLFDDGLEGDLDGFLGLFETKVKTKDVAADCSVTEALINASQHIVDSIFPGTVVAADYVNATSDKFTEITVQEYFTSAENDAVIASNNMDSINARKADLVPAALNLVREAGILPFFAKCDQDHAAAELVTVTEGGKAATCTEAGVEATVKCAECGYVVSGGTAIEALGHDLSTVTVNSTCKAEGSKTTTCSRCDYNKVETIAKKAHSYTSKVTTAATCSKEGVKTFTCPGCGDTYTEAIAKTAHSYGAWTVTKAATCDAEGTQVRKCACGATETQAIAKTAHTDDNEDNKCDVCGDEIDSSFGAKIKAFFQSIINWFKSLFGID